MTQVYILDCLNAVRLPRVILGVVIITLIKNEYNENKVISGSGWLVLKGR